jgi:hypothetical protein
MWPVLFLVVSVALGVLVAAFVPIDPQAHGGASGASGARKSNDPGLNEFPPGTRAFEAAMVMPALEAAIRTRRDQLEGADELRRFKLEEQIAFLEAQVEQNRVAMATNDLSPGKGYVGFESPPEDAST